MPFQDGLNQDVFAGDLGAFAKRDGNTATMAIAKIVSIEKFTGDYYQVRASTWDPRTRRWRQPREINHENFIRLNLSVQQFESLPSTGLA